MRFLRTAPVRTPLACRIVYSCVKQPDVAGLPLDVALRGAGASHLPNIISFDIDVAAMS